MPLLLLLGVIAVLVFWVIGAHGRLAELRGGLKSAYAQIDLHFRRRYDLIPTLVDAAKGTMKQERETLDAVIRAHRSALGASAAAAAEPGKRAAMSDLTMAEGRLSGELGKLFALAEAYPDLKANPTMMQLTDALAGTDGKIAFARQAFNQAVLDFNIAVREFPTSILAVAFSFHAAEPLQAGSAGDQRRPAKSQY